MSLNHKVNINRHGIGGDWKPLGFLAVVAGGTVFGKCTWKEESAEAFSIPKTAVKPYEVESRNNEKTIYRSLTISVTTTGTTGFDHSINNKQPRFPMLTSDQGPTEEVANTIVYKKFRVTLWEFGAGRLDSGQSTAPLQPIGTPADGLSTTYLYRVMTSIPSTSELNDDGSPVFTTFVSTATRTIVASASGWIEKFGTTNTIQCNFLNSEGGECFDATRSNTGVPTPIVLGVEPSITSTPANVPAFSTTLPLTQISSPIVSPTSTSSSITPTVPPKSSTTREIIIGVTIAGSFVLCALVILMIWVLRRQRRSLPVSNTKNVDGLLEPFPYTANATVTRGIFHLYPQVGPSASDKTSTVIPPSKMLHSLEVSKGCTRMASFLAASTLGHFEHGYDSKHREVAAVAAPSSEVEVKKVLKRLMREEEKLLPRGRKGMMMISGGGF
ncbi:hypothetical protein GG344DRAFT_61381 [Lentinula edodes]|nr:hypothetical protein GG344DRAFT_61381 [Lentinula edodes]